MSFHRAFKHSLGTAGRVFGAGCSWTFAGTTRAALTVGSLTAQQRAILGGRLGDVHLSVSMTAELWAAAQAQTPVGADSGQRITVTGPDLAPTEVRIADVEIPGNGSVVLICGPVGIATPRG